MSLCHRYYGISTGSLEYSSYDDENTTVTITGGTIPDNHGVSRRSSFQTRATMSATVISARPICTRLQA